jgi:hypothetical protein
MSVARALALANDVAAEEGTNPAQALITITEDPTGNGRGWRIHYGPRQYIGRRGGDLTVIVDEQSSHAPRIVRGQ